VLEGKAIIHFSGVLGIHPYELAYRTAYDYTPYLAALMWMGRLIILEYALPLRAYTTLDIPWPARASYEDQGKRLCVEIRPRYLQRGSFSPMGYLIERLQHGRAIAKREGPRTNISWSLDGCTLEVAGARITMQELRETIHQLLARLEQTTRELMFDWWPQVELGAVKDTLVTYRPGYSFLQEPANQLQSSFKHLSRRAFSRDGGQFAVKGKGRERAMAYLKGCNRLVRLLFSGIHTTSGMPGRGEELRVVRWADTAAVQRNIFICQGRILLVFSYNKASRNANNSFFIVRVPCPAVERCLFLYLAYIRPFSSFLSRQLELLSATAPTNPHLFTVYDSASACFSSPACSKTLEQSTAGCPVRLNFQTYRQIAVAVSKKHLPGLTQPFDPNTPNDYGGFLRLLSFQTGHNPSTHASAYALDRAYPAKLQPELVERYFEGSRTWHRFLAVAEEKDPIAGAHAPGYPPPPPTNRAQGLSSPPEVVLEEVDVSSTDDDAVVSYAWSSRAGKRPRKRKHSKGERRSATQREIDALRAALAKLERETKRRKVRGSDGRKVAKDGAASSSGRRRHTEREREGGRGAGAGGSAAVPAPVVQTLRRPRKAVAVVVEAAERARRVVMRSDEDESSSSESESGSGSGSGSWSGSWSGSGSSSSSSSDNGDDDEDALHKPTSSVGYNDEWQQVQKVMDEIRTGCVACWTLAKGAKDGWRKHRTMQCTARAGVTGMELDRFRRGIRDGGGCRSCRRCWVSQKYCATGEDAGNRCQRPNHVGPLVRVAAEVKVGRRIIRQCGYDGELGGDWTEYALWLGKRHQHRVWGEYFSNAMVVAIRIIQGFV
jgi:hypothetical protein